MKVIFFLLLLVSAYSLEWKDFTEDEKLSMFQDWKREYNQTFNKYEEPYRYRVFKKNSEVIFEHNKNPHKTFVMGANQFTGMTGDEFRQYVMGAEGYCLRPGWKRSTVVPETRPGSKAPASVDWAAQGKVTPVKNQEQCGSCWAFSTTGSIESAHAIKNNKLVSLSEQQLVDCSRSYGNKGCQGGLMDDAFKYVRSEGGLCTEEEYRYTAKNGVCKASFCGKKYDAISGYRDVTADSATSLEEAVAVGPVSIAIEADQTSFQHYRSGVLSGLCGTRLDHGVLVVGYGTSGGQEFWKVKNSWGKTWGEEGYVRLCRGCSKNRGKGECGILMQPSYPLAQ